MSVQESIGRKKKAEGKKKKKKGSREEEEKADFGYKERWSDREMGRVGMLRLGLYMKLV